MLRRSQIISTLIELVGMAAVVAGTAVLSIPAAIIVAGLCTVVVGYALGVEDTE
jgi:hypothetical protein